MRRILFFLALAATPAVAIGQTAQAIVVGADSVRNPQKPFQVTNTVVDYASGASRDRLRLTVFTKADATGQYRNLVRYDEPVRDLGKMVLLDGGNMWFYDPAPKTSVRISPQQRLIGLASNGDVVTVSLARDYTSTLVGTDTLQDADRARRECWHLNLVAADKDAVYGRIEYWVERGTFRPVKGKYYGDSGRLLKIAYFRQLEDQLGATRPVQTVIIDAVDPNLVTTMTLSGYHSQDIPDSWFQRDFLPRLSDNTVAPADNGEDKDLAAIPSAARDTVASQSVPALGSSHARRYVEDAGSVARLRGVSDAWENRTSLDIVDRWRLPARFQATLSARANVIGANDLSAGYDFREGYVTWAPAANAYLEAGRINVHNGVALGFNPTDFFKPRTVVDQASEDPSVTREDRLGTLMVRGQAIWNGGSASLAFAPKLYAPTAIMTGVHSGTTLALDRTNAAVRWLATVNVDVGGMAPHLLLYREGNETHIGADISRLLTPSIVAYAEWAGGVERGVASEAVSYGKVTGSLPALTPVPALGDSGRHFMNDVAAGASWSSGQTTKLTINAEYHYHEAGLDGAEWRRWFAMSADAQTSRELGYVRAFANDQQEPIARHEVFLRADRVDAFIHNLELTAFAFVDLSDGSSLVQLAISYLASDSWTMALYLPANLGSTHSERGSLPQSGGLILQVVRFF